MKNYLQKNQKELLFAFISTFVLGIIAHGYSFAHLSLSHDSLNEFFLWGDVNYSSGNVFDFKIATGRFIKPFYQIIFHGATSPAWLIGILSLLWLSLSVFWVCKLFSIKNKWAIAIVSGIFTLNLTVTATTATYIQDLDANMFAVLLAVLAAYLWNQGNKKTYLMIPLLVLVLGIYQSMLSITITLIMFKCILMLLENTNSIDVTKKGLLAILNIIIAGAIYLILTKAICSLTALELNSGYNSLSNVWQSGGLSLFTSLYRTYIYCVYKFFVQPTASFPILILILNILVAALIIINVVYKFIHNKLKASNIVITIILGMLLPLGMNLSFFFAQMLHDLMTFSFWLVYLLLLLLVLPSLNEIKTSTIKKASCYIGLLSIILILCSYVQTSNAAYIKKGMEEQTTLSTMTRVVYQLENTTGYEPGKTEVLFVGTPTCNSNDMYPSLSKLTGMDYTSVISTPNYYESYFKYILGQPINVYCTQYHNYENYDKALQKAGANAMPSFPNKGYIKWYKNTLVVKLSE